MIGSIQRYLNESNYGSSIINDIEFAKTRQAIKAKTKQLKRIGKGNKPNASSPLTDEEMDVLYTKGLLGCATPESVINNLWLNNCVYFGMRGCTENRNLQWGDVKLLSDQSGLEFLELNERQTKTRQGDDIRNVRPVKPRMYAVQGSNRCPVTLYNFYREKRPQQMCDPNSPFYLGINIIRREESEKPWFKKSPMGINKLNSLMKVMASKGELNNSKLTNHSARKRLVQKLVSSDVQPTEIIQITGHRNLQSINNYSCLSESKLKNISSILSNAPNHTTESSEISATTSSCYGGQIAPTSFLSNAVFHGDVNIKFEGLNDTSSANRAMSINTCLLYTSDAADE